MLLYLASNSRPDISFAVHCCAQFSHNPKASHERAVLRICRYLKGTASQGLIYRPSKNTTIDCHVNADFAGAYSVEDQTTRRSCKSQTGFVILVANCPLLWVSKLQQEIALESTAKAETIALSQAMRQLIIVQHVIHKVLSMLKVPKTDVLLSKKATVFQDNAACLQMATTKKLTNRTKHMAIKHFWFLDKIGTIAYIKKIESDNNLGDFWTKPHLPKKFLRFCKMICGW